MTRIIIHQQVVFPNTTEGRTFANMYQDQMEKYRTFRKREEGTQSITIHTESFEEINWQESEEEE